ncbi:hypothetical protein IF2G_09814 [Cordyceps javanica]|nr:hypothetical protein IF2G_09814 [Cordyceps javanica]
MPDSVCAFYAGGDVPFLFVSMERGREGGGRAGACLFGYRVPMDERLFLEAWQQVMLACRNVAGKAVKSLRWPRCFFEVRRHGVLGSL